MLDCSTVRVCLNMQVQVEKSSIGWELEELEQAAHLVATGDSTQHSEEEDEQESVTSSSDEEDTESASCEDDCRYVRSSDADERNVTRVSDCGNCMRGSVTTTAGNAVVGDSTDKSHAEHIDSASHQISSHTEAVSNKAKAVQENESVGLEKESISTHHPKSTSAPKSGHSLVGDRSTLHPDSLCDSDIGGLTEELYTLLTLQPRRQHTTSAQNLMEKLN